MVTVMRPMLKAEPLTAQQGGLYVTYVVHEKLHKLKSHKTVVDLYSRPHGPTARQVDDAMLIRILFQNSCAVYETMKLESAKVIVKDFF